VGIEVMLAAMLEGGAMSPVDIWVCSRAIEDAIDLVLIKSQRAADLAQLATETDKLASLAASWRKQQRPFAALNEALNEAPLEAGVALPAVPGTGEGPRAVKLTESVAESVAESAAEGAAESAGRAAAESDARRRQRRLVPCVVADPPALRVESLVVARGTARVSLAVEIPADGRFIAVTGPNGCGKSTTLGDPPPALLFTPPPPPSKTAALCTALDGRPRDVFILLDSLVFSSLKYCLKLKS
jgi:hypothetical protein